MIKLTHILNEGSSSDYKYTFGNYEVELKNRQVFFRKNGKAIKVIEVKPTYGKHELKVMAAVVAKGVGHELAEADSYDRLDDDEGEPSVFLVDEKVTDSLYDIHEIIKFIDKDLNDNDLGGDVAKPVLESVATQLNDLHDELIKITDEEDRLVTPYR